VNTGAVFAAFLKFEGMILYHYIIPNNQTANYETFILIGYRNIRPQVIKDIFELFFVCKLECAHHYQIYITILNNINYDKNNLLNHSCRWVDQIFFGELLDLAEIYLPTAYVYHWGAYKSDQTYINIKAASDYFKF